MDTVLKLCFEEKRKTGLDSNDMRLTMLLTESCAKRELIVVTKNATEDLMDAKMVA